MADDTKFSPIEKALPNIQNLDLDKDDAAPPVEVNVGEEVIEEQGPRITELGDGGVEVNFDPSQVGPQDTSDHNSNLAEVLPENV